MSHTYRLPEVALSRTEFAVLGMILNGYSLYEIAAQRHNAAKTIETHAQHIRMKFGLDAHMPVGSSRLALLAPALERYGLSILEPDSRLRIAIEGLFPR